MADAPANPFADLEAAQAAQDAASRAPQSAPASNPFADLEDAQAAQAPKSTGYTVAAAPFVGFNKFIKSAISAPGDLLGYGMAKLTGDESYRGAGTRAASSEMGSVDPDTHPANSGLERILQSTGEGAAGALLPEAAVGTALRYGAAKIAPRVADLASSAFGDYSKGSQVATNLGVGAAAGASGQLASEVVPDRWKPEAQFAGSMLGGGAGALTIHGAGAVAKAGVDALHDYAPAGLKAGPDGSYTPAQMDMARKSLVGAMGDDAFEAQHALADQKPSAVPGFVPTPYQLTGNKGLGALEEGLGQSDAGFRGDLVDRRAQQNNAIVDHVVGQQKDGSASAVPQLFNDQLAQFDKLAESRINAAQAGASSADAAVGGAGTAESAGNALRGNLQGGYDAVDAKEHGLWDLLPNDLAVNMQPVAGAAKGAYDGLSKAAASDITPAEKSIRDLAGGYNTVEPFQELKDLRSKITTAIRNDKASDAPNPMAQRRLSLVLDGVNQVIGDGVQTQAMRDAHAVAAGAMKPEDTLQAKLQDFGDTWDGPGSDASGVSAGAATGTDAQVGARPSGNSSSVGAASQGQRGLQQAPSDTGIPQAHLDAPIFDDTAVTQRPVPPSVPRPQDLHGFIKSAGGMQDPGGDLASMGLSKLIAKPGQGLGPDAMRQAAAQSGYLGADIDHATANTRVNDLLDVVGSDKPVHSIYDEDAAAQWAHHDDMLEQYNRVRGPAGKPAMPPKAPLSAYGADVIYPPGMQPHADVGNRLVANFTPQDAANLRAASEMTRYKKSYNDGAVGDVLQSNGRAGQYQMLDSIVPDKLVRSGPAGEQIAKDYIDKARGLSPGGKYSAEERAAGDDRAQNAIKDLENATAVKYRREAMKNGEPNQAKHDAFMAKHADLLRAVPEVAKRFDTLAQANQRVADIAASRKAMLDEAQAGAFGKMMGNKDPVKGLEQILGQSDRVYQVKQLADRVNAEANRPGGSDDAKIGLRKAFVDLIERKFLSNTEAGTTERPQLKNDQFQTFIKSNKAAMAQVFSPAEIKNFEAANEALMHRNRSVSGLKLPGGSDTTQKLFPLLKKALDEHDSSSPTLEAAKAVAVGAFTGHLVPGAGAAAGIIGKSVLGRLRDAGIRKSGDLVKKALLDPELMKTLMSRVPIKPNTGSEVTLAHRLSKVALISGLNDATQPR